MSFKIAFGTDDKVNFTYNHFGDSECFLIYEFDNGNFNFLEERENKKFDEETHGDKKKASHISEQLKEIDVLVSKVFGPNIVRIRKKFVPVVSRIEKIEDTFEKLKELEENINKEIKKESDKEIFYLK